MAMQFLATMRVVHIETWCVEAKDEDDAREKFNACDKTVDVDESGGEVSDWEILKIERSE